MQKNYFQALELKHSNRMLFEIARLFVFPYWWGPNYMRDRTDPLLYPLCGEQKFYTKSCCTLVMKEFCVYWQRWSVCFLHALLQLMQMLTIIEEMHKVPGVCNAYSCLHIYGSDPMRLISHAACFVFKSKRILALNTTTKLKLVLY